MKQGYDEPGLSAGACALLLGCGLLVVLALIAFGAVMSTWWVYR